MQQAKRARDEALSLDSAAEGGSGRFAALLLEGGGRPATGVVLLHGRNGNPDSAVVGPLRRSLNAAGYTTLSLQNPIPRSEEHTSELQSLMRISYAVFCLKKKNIKKNKATNIQ